MDVEVAVWPHEKKPVDTAGYNSDCSCAGTAQHGMALEKVVTGCAPGSDAAALADMLCLLLQVPTVRTLWSAVLTVRQTSPWT